MIIFGEGELRKELEEQISSLGLEERIFLPGTDPQSVKVVNKAAVFVLSSDLEGMPNVLMEAMAMGVPCVSTRCDMGPEELIENGKNGILVDVGSTQQIADSILEIINNPELSDELSTNARELLKTHSIDSISQKWLEFLNKI
jgi:glycosyltransferase involved in cell wall biosynthesis